MEQQKKQEITRRSLSNSIYRSAVFFTMLFLLPLATTAQITSLKIAQQQGQNQQTAIYIKGQQLLEEAQKLLQGSAASKLQAIALYEQALKIWQQIGDRNQEATTLLSIGTVYYILTENQKALTYYNQALAIRRSLNDPLGTAIMLSSVGGAYFDLGNQQQALAAYQEARSLFQSQKQFSLAAKTLISIGRIYSHLGATQTAIDSYNSALELQRTEGDFAGVADTLGALGTLYTSIGNQKKALESLNQALEIQRSNKDALGQIDILNSLGAAYTAFNDNQNALTAYNTALSLQPENSFTQSITLIGIAATYKALGENQKALTAYNKALSLQREAGNRFAEAETLNQLGFFYDELGEKQKAINSLQQALKLQRAIKNPAREAFTLSNIGGIYNSIGENQQALDSLNQALEIQRQVGDRPSIAVTLNDIARVYSSLGNYQLSIDTYNQALEIFRDVGDRTRVGQTLDNIGSLYRLLENYQQALEYYNSALLIWREQGDIFRQVATLTGIIRAYESLKDYPQALNVANSALSLAKTNNNSFAEGAAYALLGRVYLAAQNYQPALESSQQALNLFQKLGIRLAAANTLDNIGKVYNGLKEPKQAIASYNTALSLRQILGDRTGEADTLYNIALSERDRGNFNAARSQIETVIAIVEDVRTKVASQELRASYLASVQKYYQFYIDLLMRLHLQQPSKGYDALALQVSERSRARSLLEILTEAHANIRQGVKPQLLEQEQALQQKLTAAEERRIQLLNGSFTPEQVTTLDQEISALLAQYQEVQAQIRATSPKYAALTQPQPLTLAEIQKQVLDDQTLLLEYSLGEERSYLWAVSKTGITSYELPKRADIEAAGRNLRKLLIKPPSALATPKKLAQAALPLTQMLLKPVAAQLQQKRLLIVGDGILQYLPFGALPNPNASATPLLLEHEIVTLPSASTLAVLRHEHKGRKLAPKTVAVLADPVFSRDDQRVNKTSGSLPQTDTDLSQDLARSARATGVTFERLPGTRQEAEQIISLVPKATRKQVFNFAASRATVTSSELAQYQIVHFATHGILNSVNPDLSGIVLSLVNEQGTPQNGFLRLHEIFNLNLPAELIVLSACQTGLGKEIKGEGLVGLTRGFMYAGSPRVVVSLWSVDDQATALLMTKFYQGMLKQGLKPAAALRAAQIEMWKQQQWKSPYFWAAFVLQGEWK